jgi:hypothetical protein
VELVAARKPAYLLWGRKSMLRRERTAGTEKVILSSPD